MPLLQINMQPSKLAVLIIVVLQDKAFNRGEHDYAICCAPCSAPLYHALQQIYPNPATCIIHAKLGAGVHLPGNVNSGSVGL